MSSRIRESAAQRIDPESQWQGAVASLRRQRGAPNEFRKTWGETFAIDDPQQVAATPMWFPDDDAWQHSNLAGWMRELGLRNFADFHRWSIQNRSEFWQRAVQRLDICFQHPADAILNLDAGVENAVWFPGARINIVESILAGDAARPAVIASAPEAKIRTITLGQLREQTWRVAHSIRAAGWQPGDCLAVVLPMTAWSIPIYLGIVAAGCAVVSIADSFAPAEIANRLRIAGAKGVFTYDRMSRAGKTIPLYDRVRQSSELPAVVLPLESEVSVPLRKQDIDWDSFLGNDQTPLLHVDDAHSCINVLFSSGTTGDPKAIVWNHLTAIKCAVDGHLHQDIRPNHVVVWPTNLGWMMGPWLIFAALLNRGTIGLYEDVPTTAGFGQFIQDAGVNMLGVVPTIVKSWRSTGIMEQFDWSKIHTFSSTGETSHPEDMFYLSSLAGMRPIIEYCGGTEVGGGYITSTVVQPNYPSAFTTPAAGLDFVLLDADSQVSDAGELFLVPPSVGLSSRLLNRNHHETYFEGTPSLKQYPVLRRHGDHFRRLSVGAYVAGGRVDDTMNLGGIKTSSAEIERVCNLVDGIKETAAIAVAEQHGPDELVVFAVAAADRPLAEIQLEMNQSLKEHLNPLFKVSRVILVESLPRTASNKVMRRKLREQIEKGS